MEVLDALEDEPLESHSGDIGNNGHIVWIEQGMVL